jgi:Ni,Fe-hydrogenase I large subunit
MHISKKQYSIIFLALLSFLLLFFIFNWMDYLVKNQYVVENFEQNSSNSNSNETVCVPKNLIKQEGPNYVMQSSLTSHTVNMPLTTKTSCNNFCGPPAKCSITGDQCTSDVDCPGCLPYEPSTIVQTKNIPGQNDAGKLTFNNAPRYSSLTTDIGTQARLITDNKFSRPAMADFGENTWRSYFDEDENQFNSAFKTKPLTNMPNYKNRYSLSGEFIDEGPLASNAYLS